MISLKLTLYQNDFKVHTNFGGFHRILRSIFIACLVVISSIILVPVSKELAFFISLIILIVSLNITDTYLRKIYPDWPNSNKFIGTIIFSENLITINTQNENIELLITDCNELMLFIDHFSGFKANKRDIERNGNGLLFYKNNNGKISVFKFNVFNKIQHDKLETLIDLYKVQIPYFKKYLPFEISHILKPNLTERRKYN